MNRFFAMGAVLAVAAWCDAGTQIEAAETKFDPNSVVIREARDFTARGGLPNFCRKLAEGKKVKIAYLGGSITQQKGWRVLSLDYFREQYPASDAEEIQAALGGTGSPLGVCRLQQDVIRKKPDLLFVEFAVNDGNYRNIDIRRAMEGIVRHTWRELPETDICFIYTITETGMKAMLDGKMSRTASVMEDIADHYNIPTIHFGVDVAKLVRDGKLIMKADSRGLTAIAGDSLNIKSKVPMTADGKVPFAKDGVHPYLNTGHVIYTNTLKRVLPEIAKAGTAGPHLPLPPPVMKDNYEFISVCRLDDPALRLSGKITRLAPDDPPIPSRFRTFMPDLWKLEPGAAIEFRFKGSMMMLYDIFGPGCGCAEITIDGRKPIKVYSFDRHGSYYRICSNFLPNLQGDGVHTVKIKVPEKPFDKRKMLTRLKAGTKDIDENPEKYAEQNLYIASIFICGELVK